MLKRLGDIVDGKGTFAAIDIIMMALDAQICNLHIMVEMSADKDFQKALSDVYCELSALRLKFVNTRSYEFDLHAYEVIRAQIRMAMRIQKPYGILLEDTYKQMIVCHEAIKIFLQKRNNS